MRKIIIGILSSIGLYQLLLKQKRKFDNRNTKRVEEKNSRNRLAFYSKFISKGDLVFDVGANIGNRSENFVVLGARVVAVEPQPDCIDTLKEKLGDRIIIEPIGLGKEPGEMDMYIANESTISTFSKEFIDKTKDNKFKRNTWNDSIKVQISTLNHLIAKHGMPVFCKMDVEGFETEVLKGLTHPISAISFEYNVPEMSANVYENIELLKTLSSQYKYNYCKGESMKWELEKWMNSKEFGEHVRTQAFLESDFGDIYAFINPKQIS